MANEANPSPQYSRLSTIGNPHSTKRAVPSRIQRLVERSLFLAFGGMVALAAFTLYATGTDAHNTVPSSVKAGLASDRVNLLLMTSEPRSRYGSEVDVTSSLTLLSLQPSTRKAVMIGLPAHLWSDLGTHGQRPLGAALEVGASAGSPGGGEGLTIDAVQRATGMTVHSFARIDLRELARLIDRTGGIELIATDGLYEVRTRSKYPPGRLHLKGEQALLYGFSRHVTGADDETMRREARRQAVIAAVASRLLKDGHSDFALDRIRTNLTAHDAATLRSLLSTSTVSRIDLAPLLVPVQKKTAVYDGEAWIPKADLHGSLHTASGALLTETSIRN